MLRSEETMMACFGLKGASVINRVTSRLLFVLRNPCLLFKVGVWILRNISVDLTTREFISIALSGSV